MVREIIHVSVGQCGIMMGNDFWDTLRCEHHLDHTGVYNSIYADINEYQRLNRINVFFKEVNVKMEHTDKRKFVPRACIVDLEPGLYDVIQSSSLNQFYKPDNMVFGACGAGNNWSKGHYTEGAELIDEVMDVVRLETESADCPQAFQMTHSLGGGTGSGLGTLILIKIRDNYPWIITATYSVFSSPKVSDVVVEPYNVVLSMHQLLENSDETFVIDNAALFNITTKVLKQKKPKYSDLNWLISNVMSGCTASLRFSGTLNADMRTLGVNLVPFPRLHFFLCSQAPIFALNEELKVNLSIQELTDQMWSARNFLADIKPENGKYLSGACIYRGNIIDYNMIINGFIRQSGLLGSNKIIPKEILDLFYKFFSWRKNMNKCIISTQEVDDEIAKTQQKMADDFVNWIPNNIKTSIIGIAPNNTSMSGTFIANTTAIKDMFKRISAQFAKMYKRKAFLHHYKGEGMDEMEYQESDKNLRDLITEYQDKQDVVVDLDHLYEVDNDEEYEDDDDDEDEVDEEEEEEEL